MMSNNLAVQYLEELKKKITRIQSVIECIESELAVSNKPTSYARLKGEMVHSPIGRFWAKSYEVSHPNSNAADSNLEPSGNNSPIKGNPEEPKINISEEEDRFIREGVHSSDHTDDHPSEIQNVNNFLDYLDEEKEKHLAIPKKALPKTDRRTKFQAQKKAWAIELLKATNRVTTSGEIRKYLIYKTGKEVTWGDVCYSLNALCADGYVRKLELGRWELAEGAKEVPLTASEFVQQNFKKG